MFAFYKYHGLGNDFIVVENPPSSLERKLLDPNTAKQLCHRNRGIGGDGILIVSTETAQPHARMTVVNADGSRPEMCGNGVRCVARYLSDHNATFAQQSEFIIQTDAGPRLCRLGGHRNQWTVEVDMGVVHVEQLEYSISIRDQSFTGTVVNVGNPHFVQFFPQQRMDSLADMAKDIGPSVAGHAQFAGGINAGFASINPTKHVIELAVWERGSGFTTACGTAACAAVVAASASKKVTPSDDGIRVRLPGGDLTIKTDGEEKSPRVLMRGPAVEVFHGTYDLS